MDDDMVMIWGSSNGAAVSVLLRDMNLILLDDMDMQHSRHLQHSPV